MRLTYEGLDPLSSVECAPLERGLALMGVSDQVEVVLAANFDEVVRERTRSTTYSSERGTGLVAARTLSTSEGVCIIVNAVAIDTLDEAARERLLAHEAGHALMYLRGEGLDRWHRDLVESDWEWFLLCIAAYALDEARVEMAVWEVGRGESDAASTEHLVEVLHFTTCDVLVLLADPAAADPAVLQDGMLRLLDRLSKVLAYVAARVISTNSDVDVAERGPLAVEAWQDHVARSWTERIEIYRATPPATESFDEDFYEGLLLDALDVEIALLRDLGFEFREVDGQIGFFRIASQDTLARWLARAHQQERLYEKTGND